MKKTYIEIFAEIFKNFHGKLQEQQKELSDLFDKIIVWLIGLSTGAIVLIISSFEKLTLNKSHLYTILILLVLSILTGIIGRILYAIATSISYSQAAAFDMAIETLEIPHRPRKLDGTETAEEIHSYILEDFKTDIPSIIENKGKSPREKWAEIDATTRDFYLEYSKADLLALQQALKEINKITISSFGLKDDYFDKRKAKDNRTNGIISRVLTSTSYWLYILSAMSFCSAVLYLTIAYSSIFK